jgi:hypothetical protein
VPLVVALLHHTVPPNRSMMHSWPWLSRVRLQGPLVEVVFELHVTVPV